VQNPDHVQDTSGATDNGARIMLVVLCIVWGATWPIMRVALSEVPPLTMRTTSTAIGGALLLAFSLFTHRSLRLHGPRAWLHIVVASLLNVVSFSLFSSFAQLDAATSHVAILTYTMPIWAVLLAWIFLGEKPTGMQPVAVALCAIGLAILIYPLAQNGVPRGILLALATGVCWAGGTIYLKWAQIKADAMALSVWQIAVALLVIGACMFVVEGGPDFHAAHADGIVATVFSGILGTAIAYALWFSIIRRLPALTASLGVLGSPVIGVISSVLLLGERPTATDYIGFSLILAASACALFSRGVPSVPAAVRGIGDKATT
jgi:drug/metabolite transporter (DMT)-like permease